MNAYRPGIVDTAMGQDVKQYVDQMVALKRIKRPGDVAGLVSYLASKDSDYMTGRSAIIDGGIHFSRGLPFGTKGGVEW